MIKSITETLNNHQRVEKHGAYFICFGRSNHYVTSPNTDCESSPNTDCVSSSNTDCVSSPNTDCPNNNFRSSSDTESRNEMPPCSRVGRGRVDGLSEVL